MATAAAQIDAALRAAGLPIEGVSGPLQVQGAAQSGSTYHSRTGGWFRVDWRQGSPTAPQATQASVIITAWVPVTALEETRKGAKERLDAPDSSDHALIRAVALAMLDAVNQVRQNPAAVLPAITPAQLKNAIRQKLDSGEAD